jgi:hypothetical protein
VGHADERRDAACRARDLAQRALGGVEEAGTQQEVLGRVAGHRQLGEEDEVGLCLLRLVEARKDPLPVPFEVADRGVDLS